MTTSLPRRGPSPFNPAATPSPSRTPNLFNRMESRPEHRKSTVDESSDDKNTVALIRRVLCPDASTYGSSAPRPLQELLPPLTSSNDVDLQLYALIAVIIKEFVYSWYAKITPDHIFVDEVLQLIAHCTRALEQRVRQVDVGQLVLDEIAGLVEAHITAYRIAARRSDLVSVKSSTREVYHKLNPHPGLSPVPDPSSMEQQENERLYRHLLAQGVLAVLLPTEDLENVCLRTLVEDVLSDLILGNEVGGRTCESWFIWTTVSKIISLTKQRDAAPMLRSDKGSDNVAESSRLELFGLLSEDEVKSEPIPRKTESKMLLWVWKMLYSIYLAYLTIHFLIGGLIRTAFSSPGASTKEANPADQLPSTQAVTPRPVISYKAFSLISQLVGLPWRMPWVIGSLSLIQSLALAGPGKLGDADSILDRYLRDLIGTYILTPTILPGLLFTVRTTLFPSNARVPPNNGSGVEQVSSRINDDQLHIGQQQHLPSMRGTDMKSSNIKDLPTSAPPSRQGNSNNPSPSEVAAIKRQCASDILSLIPDSLARAFFCGVNMNNTNNRSPNSEQRNLSQGTVDDDPSHAKERQGKEDEEELLTIIENDLLDPFSDAYCNKHLIFSIIEMVLVKLIPELSEHNVSGLMEERGIIISGIN